MSVVRARLVPCASYVWADLWRRARGHECRRRLGKALCSTATPLELDASTDVEAPPFNAFLDFKFVQENLDLVRENCRKRKAPADPDAVARLYSEYIAAKLKSEKLRAERNENGKAMKVRTVIECSGETSLGTFRENWTPKNDRDALRWDLSSNRRSRQWKWNWSLCRIDYSAKDNDCQISHIRQCPMEMKTVPLCSRQ